jgi:hypothetical protein
MNCRQCFLTVALFGLFINLGVAAKPANFALGAKACAISVLEARCHRDANVQ